MRFRSLSTIGAVALAQAVSAGAAAQTLNVVTAGDQNMVDYVNNYLAPKFEAMNPGVKVRAVGTGPGERLLVVLTSEARGTEGESPFQVEAGQAIELEATVTALDGDPADFGLDADEGADELTTQGVYLLATSVALS